MEVRLSLAQPEERLLLERLYPLYLHDLSEHTDEYVLDQQGVFQPDLLDWWLTHPGIAHPLLIRADDRPAGFVFVGQRPFPYMSEDRDYRLVELFVLRGLRRRRVAAQALSQALERFGGRWELAVLEHNRGALAFWRRELGARGDYREHAEDGLAMFRFSS